MVKNIPISTSVALELDISQTPNERVVRFALRQSADHQLDISLVKFDATHFQDIQFHTHGINCPPSVAGSVRRRKAEFFFGRLAAAHSLAIKGRGPSQIGIGAGREPIWPLGVVGSISHTAELAAALVLDANIYASVGIDIEHVIASDMRDALLSTAMSMEELEHLESVADKLSLDVAITTVFSAKESLYKAAFLHVGRPFDFRAACLTEFNTQQRKLKFVLKENLSAYFRAGRICEIHYHLIGGGIVLTNYTLFARTVSDSQCGSSLDS